ncbi:hypothetical protein ABBQ32_013066 [Trebouxia sp. C0010 RCD-2024]
MVLRRQVYQVMSDNMPPSDHILVAGNWNAAYTVADRASAQVSAADKAHQQLLADLQLSPTDADTDSQSRHQTFYSKGDASHHSRIDNQVISDNLRTGRKAPTVVLKNVTDDSDHDPILSNISLEAMMFQRPDPEALAPDKTATLKLPPTKQQQ